MIARSLATKKQYQRLMSLCRTKSSNFCHQSFVLSNFFLLALDKQLQNKLRKRIFDEKDNTRLRSFEYGHAYSGQRISGHR